MSFDLRRSLRRIKPHSFAGPLRRRPKTDLPFISDPPTAGKALILDTCVYVDVLQGKTPAELDALLQLRTLNHLSVCLAELTHAFGRLDPAHPATGAVLDTLSGMISDIPPHRLAAASVAVVVEAGILAGLLFRLGNLESGQETAALNDATLFLHALANGQTVLTRNLREFDIMNQIMPAGPVLFYQPVD